MNNNILASILFVIVIAVLVCTCTENFKNPPSTMMFSDVFLKDTKYNTLDPVRFHSRLNTNKLENPEDYYYGYGRPSLTNDNEMSAHAKYKKGLVGVDINRRTWPGFKYEPYK